MAREFKEVAKFKTDVEKYHANYEHIFGNKEKVEDMKVGDPITEFNYKDAEVASKRIRDLEAQLLLKDQISDEQFRNYQHLSKLMDEKISQLKEVELNLLAQSLSSESLLNRLNVAVEALEEIASYEEYYLNIVSPALAKVKEMK